MQTRLAADNDDRPAAPRRALLIFADALARDLGRRGWSRRFRPVLDAGAAALNGRTAAAAAKDFDVHLFIAAPGPPDPAAGIHRQEGRTFAERLENAVERLARLGYDHLVLVGRDCPGLEKEDVRRAFARLARPACRLVLGPDHRGGSYLIGLRAADRGALLGGVRWQRNTDFAELRRRAGARAAFVLPVKQDLDTWADLRLLARSTAVADRWRGLVARLLSALEEFFAAAARATPPRVDAFRRSRRRRWQLPPPAPAAAAA